MSVLDLFSGIGGMSLGLESVGFRTVAFCELDPFCREVLAHHWPGVPIHDDVRTLRGSDVGAVDLVAGGFPCQPVSVAGKRKGQADDRWLWPEMLRLVCELRPRWVLAENVPGLRTLGADRVLEDLEAEGYACWPLVVGADDVGAPHRRKRVWIVAHREVGRDRGRLADTSGAAWREQPGRCAGARGQGAAEPGWCGTPLADSDAPGCSAERSSGLLDGERQAPRDDADGRGERPVGEPTGRGLAGPGGSDAGALPAAPTLRWPTRPGEPQHEWEPARLLERGVGRDSAGLPERLVRRANREALRALGNAVVPAVVAQIGLAILAAEGVTR